MSKNTATNNSAIYKFLQILLVVLLGYSCATTKKKRASTSEDDTVEQTNKVAKSNEVEESREKIYVSGNTRTITYSVSNNKYTSYTIDRVKVQEKAERLADSVRNPSYKDSNAVFGLAALRNIAGMPVADVVDATKKLINIKMGKDIKADAPDSAKLQLALSAFRAGNYSLAEHFVYKLIKSKDKRIKAGAYTLEGLIALRDQRVPEAVEAWQDALKAIPNFLPAKLNIGFTSLKYGDYKMAQKMLGGIQGDWFALYGLLVAARLQGNVARVSSLCSNVLAKRKDYKPALFSCALNEYQGKQNFAKARSMLNQMLKTSRGLVILDEKAYRILERIDRDERLSKQQRAAKARAKAAKKQDNAKNKAKDQG